DCRRGPRIGLDTARSDSCYRETSNRIPEERLSIFHITRDTTSSYILATPFDPGCRRGIGPIPFRLGLCAGRPLTLRCVHISSYARTLSPGRAYCPSNCSPREAV